MVAVRRSGLTSRLPNIVWWVLVVGGVTAVIVRLLLLANVEPQLENDFVQDYRSAEAWLVGQDPYEPQTAAAQRYQGAIRVGVADAELRNPHPPANILIVAPFTALPLRVARDAWMIMDAALLVAGLAIFGRALGLSSRWAVGLGIGALALPIAQDGMRWVQSDGLLLLLIGAAFMSLQQGKDVRGGLLLGVAGAIKLFPLFLVVPLIRQRRWRAVSWQLGVAAGVSLTATILVGFSASRTFVVDASPWNFELWRATPGNISLVGLPFRWLTSTPWRPWSADMPSLAMSLSAALLVVAVIAAYATPARASGNRFLAGLPWMVAASPLAWEHYLVFLIPTILAAVIHLGRTNARLVWPLLIGSGLLMVDPIFFDPQAGTLQTVMLATPTLGVVLIAMSEWTTAGGPPIPSHRSGGPLTRTSRPVTRARR